MKTQGFSKQERITSQKVIDALFTSGQSYSLTAFPLRAVYIVREKQSPLTPVVQLLISVPKRRFKRAVDRNRVKRQLREAFRKHKQLLSAHMAEEQTVAVAFVWLSDSHFSSAHIEKQVVSLLKRIAEKLSSLPSTP